MDDKSLDEINKREAAIHDEHSLDRTRIRKLRRHAFYYSYKKEKELMPDLISQMEGKNVLELGSHSWIQWLVGNNVSPEKYTGINISQRELDKGIDYSDKVAFPTEFHLMDANRLTFEDESFDVVFGGAILHHLDIERTLKGVHRVLKPGGRILFLEPMNMNPFYKIYRKLTPKERTPDEHALVAKDFKVMKGLFTFEHYFFDFLSVGTGVISLNLFGDKNYGNWINKLGYKMDRGLARFKFTYPLFARVIIYGTKK